MTSSRPEKDVNSLGSDYMHGLVVFYEDGEEEKKKKKNSPGERTLLITEQQ